MRFEIWFPKEMEHENYSNYSNYFDYKKKFYI